jgi:ATP-dependent protease HslVU (ClpYQ) peptidase subunit
VSPSEREVTLGGQAAHQADAVIAFSDEVAVPRDGLISIGNTFYKVTGVEMRRLAREISVAVVYTDVANYVVTGAP